MSRYQFGGKIPVKIIGGSLVDGEMPGAGSEYYDVTSDEPQTFEFTRYLHQREKIAILPEHMFIRGICIAYRGYQLTHGRPARPP